MRETSPEVLAEFVRVLRETGNVTTSAKACGKTTMNFYDHKRKNPEFSKAWDEAYQESGDKLEQEAWRRAHDGVEEAMMYQGRQVGVRRLYSDRLIEFLLTGIKPEKYAHRYKAELTGREGKPLIPEVSMIEVARRLSYILTQAANSPVKVEYNPQEPKAH